MLNEKPLLSVIIPVYNVEKYLCQTLDSVINQTYKNLEIICVNDGSKDGSKEILEDYKNKDSRITIIDQENQGLAAARNTGLKHFSGELVAFLDSDDWLELDFYEKLIDRLISDDSDFAVGETHYIYPDRISKTDWVNNYSFYKTDKDILETIEDKQNIIYACACWNKVYRANLIKENALEFPHGLYIEDVPFTFAATILANKISLVRGAILDYRRQNESILAKAKENRTSFDIFKIYDICEKWLEKANLPLEIKKEYQEILENFEIFNILGWLDFTCHKYKNEFYKTMRNRIKNYNMNNKYVNEETKRSFNLIKQNHSYKTYTNKIKNKKINIFKQIFSVENEYTRKVIRILGFKFSFKSKKLLKIKELEEQNEKLKIDKNHLQNNINNLQNNLTNFLLKLNEVTKINLSTAFLHKEVFPQFKEKHYGQDIVIVATGPSATKYKPLENAIHIGVNRALNLDNINFDYYFIQDYSGKTTEYIEQVNNYRKDKCTKFYGFTSEYDNTTNRIIPENHAHAAKALRYRTAWIDLPNFEPNFAYDISTQPLACFGSVVFPALQFALWTYPKRIYLVGCDCSLSGYAYDKNEKNFLAQDLVLKGYNKFKEFANKYYPDVEIISINPVGLKGLFKDEYQD